MNDGWAPALRFRDHLEIRRLAVARCVKIVEHRRERVAAALVKAASRLIIRPVRRLNVNACAARGGNLSLGFVQQQLANALALLARLDGDPVHVKAADRHGVLAETDIADSVSLLLSEDE